MLLRHNVSFVGLNQAQFVDVEKAGLGLEVPRPVLEADFLINVPVLKTHLMTRVSLGMKNLQGCLSMKARKTAHRQGLDPVIALLPDLIPVDLTVIDGVWALERGPLSGTTYRQDLLVVSRDIFAADLLGTILLGQEPPEVFQLGAYAARHGRSLDLSDLNIRGENPYGLQLHLDWFRPVVGTIFSRSRLKGFYDPGFHPLMCCFCSLPIGMMAGVFAQSNDGLDLGG